MAIEISSQVLYGALVGTASGVLVAMLLKLLGGAVGHVLSLGGMGVIGRKLSLRSYLNGLAEIAIFCGVIGLAIGVVLTFN